MLLTFFCFTETSDEQPAGPTGTAPKAKKISPHGMRGDSKSLFVETTDEYLLQVRLFAEIRLIQRSGNDL